MDDVGTLELSDAARAWTGYGVRSFPSRSDETVVERAGSVRAAELLPLLKTLEQDFYSSDANTRAQNLPQMAELAKSDFRQKHPRVADELADVFAWCYTFDFK